jgi:hypothetical protein
MEPSRQWSVCRRSSRSSSYRPRSETNDHSLWHLAFWVERFIAFFLSFFFIRPCSVFYFFYFLHGAYCKWDLSGNLSLLMLLKPMYCKIRFPHPPPLHNPPPHRWFSIVNYFWMLFYSGQGELSEVAVHLQGVSCAPSNGLWEDDVRLWIWPHVCFGGVDAMGHGIYFYLFLVLHIVHILCLIRFSLSSFHNAKILICKL